MYDFYITLPSIFMKLPAIICNQRGYIFVKLYISFGKSLHVIETNV